MGLGLRLYDIRESGEVGYSGEEEGIYPMETIYHFYTPEYILGTFADSAYFVRSYIANKNSCLQ